MRDPFRMVSVMVPIDVVRAVDRIALLRGATRSALVREAIDGLVELERARRVVEDGRDEAAERNLERRRRSWRESKRRARERAEAEA